MKRVGMERNWSRGVLGYGCHACGLINVGVIVLLFLGCGLACAGQPAADPFEPQVTKKEAELIRKVMEAENAGKGLEMLAGEDLDKASPALVFLKGNLYFQMEKLDEAEACYRKALERLPRYRQAIMNLGKVYLLQDRPKESIKLYQDLASGGQVDAEMMLLLGHALMMEGQAVSAENAYRNVLLLDVKSASARLGLVKALLRQERYPESVSLLKELLSADPSAGELWSLLSSAYLAMDRNGKAVIAIETARRLGAATPQMLAALGDLYLNRGQPVEASGAYESAFRVEDPSVSRMLRAAEGFLMTGEPGRAETLLKKAEDLSGKADHFSPKDKLTLLRLKGELAAATGKTDKAVKLYKELVRKDPLNARTMILLGNIYCEAGRYEDAASEYERAARVPGFEAEALIQQAQVEIDRERYGKAVELLENAQVFEQQPHIDQYLKQLRRLADE